LAALGYGAKVKAGQGIGLACNSVWRAPLPTAATIGTYNQSVLSITNTGAPNVVKAYAPPQGCKALPILDGSAILPNESFTSAGGGSPNVFFTPTEYFYGGSFGYEIFVWETGAASDNPTGQYLSRQMSVSAVNSTACSYYIPGLSWGGTLPSSAPIYIHTCDDSDPATNGYAYEVSEQIPLSMSSPGSTISNIEVRKTGSNTGMLNLQGNCGAYNINGVIARDGGKHNALAPSGTTVKNSEFINGYYNIAGIGDSFLVFHDSSTLGCGSLPIFVEDSVFQQDQVIAGAGASGNTSIISHTNDSSSMGTVSLNNDWFIAKNGTILGGIGFANVTGVVGSRLYGSQLANAINMLGNVKLTKSQFVSNVPSNYQIIFQTSKVSLTATDLSICGSNIAQGLLRVNGATGLRFDLQNSKLYVASPNTNNTSAIFNISSGQKFHLSGVDFGSAVSNWAPMEDYGTDDKFTGNNNTYESSGDPTWYFNGKHYTSLVAWQSAVSPADSSATEGGGKAVAACTLPNIPVVN